MTIGDRLLKLRKEKNISQEELANEFDVSRQTISKWETNQSMPDFDKIVPLCNYFGITTDELLTGSKDIVEAQETNNKSKFALNLAISIGLYICSVVAIIFFASVLNAAELGVCVFFLLIALATGLIIYNGIVYGDKRKKEAKKKENPQLKLVTEIVDIIIVIVYLLISFMTFAWHITWIIFLIGGLINTIVKLLFSFGDKSVLEEGDDSDE